MDKSLGVPLIENPAFPSILSAGPSHVKTVIETGFSAALSPLERRHVPEFLPLYDRVWKEIDR